MIFRRNIRKTGADITFRENTVVKYFARDLESEYEKADAIYKIGQLKGFDVPKPMKVCKDDNCIIFSRIYNSKSIRIMYLDYVKRRVSQEKKFEEFFEAGRVLAYMHHHLDLSSRSCWQPGKLFIAAFRELGKNLNVEVGGEPEVYLHGDYGFSNVDIHLDTKKLVIFDPSANGFVTRRANEFGTIYVDIGNFLACLEGLVPLRQQVSINWQLVPLIKEAFLKGYEQEAEYDINRELASSFAYATAKCYFSYKYVFPISRLAMNILYNSWKENKLMVHGGNER